MKTVLITGAAGFLGTHLRPALKSEYEIIAADLREPIGSDYDRWIYVKSPQDTAEAIHRYSPSLVIHAAFVNKKPESCSDADYLGAVISDNLPIYQASADAGSSLLLTSSSAVYGSGIGETPIDESFPRKPLTLYGIAKCMQELLAEHIAATRGLNLCIARLFNLCGPGQPRGLLWADWFNRLLAIESGTESELRVSHCQTARDFVDVRDAARAITLLARHFSAGDIVNVASGVSVSLQSIGMEMQRLSSRRFEIVETNPSVSRDEAQIQRGSNRYISAKWGWLPQQDWKTSLVDQWHALKKIQALSG